MKLLSVFFFSLTSTAFGQNSNLDWPESIVPTAKFMGISGSPKEMNYIYTGNEEIIQTDTYTFYKNGILKKKIGRSGSNILVKATDNKINEVITTSLESGNSQNGESFHPKEYDSLGRITLITSESISSNNVTFELGGVGARIIKYNGAVRTEDSYYKFNGQIGPLNRSRTEYSPDGIMLATCWGGEVGEVCDRNKPITEYGTNGITRNLTGKTETIYSYTNGLLTSEVRIETFPLPNKSIIEYKSYVLDDCGNWISRELSTIPHQHAPYFEKRDISYYKKCSK